MLHANGNETAAIDRLIDEHVQELKEKDFARLPDDRDMLIRLHERLEHRKAQREHREVYALAREGWIAGLVLDLLREEIAADGDETVESSGGAQRPAYARKDCDVIR